MIKWKKSRRQSAKQGKPSWVKVTMREENQRIWRDFLNDFLFGSRENVKEKVKEKAQI